MLTGKLIRLVHLSNQSDQPNSRLVPDHNDRGYGVIESADGKAVYFSHQAVEGRRGFDDLRQGQRLEYTLENAANLRAASVRPQIAKPAIVVRPPELANY